MFFSLCRGLCSIYRSEAGNFTNCQRRPDDDDDDDDDDGKVDDCKAADIPSGSSSSSSSSSSSNNNNSHWIVSMNELQQQQRESNEPIYLDCISVSSSVRAVDAANNGIDNDNEEKKEIKKLFVIEGEDVNVDDDDKKNRGSEKSKSRGAPPRLVDTSRPSNWVGYFDAASLYPSSGEPNTIESLLGLARACILQERFSAGATMSAKKPK